jgi:hypothetical protein
MCTVCVGFAGAATGAPAGGVVYRPLDGDGGGDDGGGGASWAAGCAAEGYAASAHLPRAGAAAARGGFLVSRGKPSPFLEARVRVRGRGRRPSSTRARDVL